MVDQINVPQDAKNGKNLKLRKTNYNIAKWITLFPCKYW
jgi:hypothetical protein